eukprot:TRINITY_DN1060_c0_g1_i1.p1 TRINITY_DN1060_c0_g1~~TRINITY_DN1060_c0_g1_i1.p1  ORF type:complete len:512 (+),score=85.88 TRINITY_DN1060_c0_g1_i1:28-1536(+)
MAQFLTYIFLFYLLAAPSLGRQVSAEIEIIGEGTAQEELTYDGKVYVVKHDEHLHFGSVAWYGNAAAAVLCVICAALAAGLTMGLVSVDPFELHVLLNTQPSECPDPVERAALVADQKYARKLLPLVTRHHLLLVTLLLANAAANEALPIFLDQLFPAWLAVLLSVTFVLIFGEIIPASIFTGEKQLRVSSFFSVLVWVVLFLVSPVAWPISKLLDFLFGVHDIENYKKHELKALIRMHADDAGPSDDTLNHTPTSPASPSRHRSVTLTKDEAAMMNAAMEVGDKTAGDVLIPLSNTVMVALDTVLDQRALDDLLVAGHTRLPVFQGPRHNIRGVLLTKRLISINPQDAVPLASLPLQRPVVAAFDTPLLDLLHDLQARKCHVAVIAEDPPRVAQALLDDQELPADAGVAGIVCVDDIVESVVGHAASTGATATVIVTPNSSGSSSKLAVSNGGVRRTSFLAGGFGRHASFTLAKGTQAANATANRSGSQVQPLLGVEMEPV